MKEKIKEVKDNIVVFVKAHKKESIVVLILVCVLALGASVGGVTYAVKHKDKDKVKEESLSDLLEQMGIDFYENKYYNQLGDDEEKRNEFLEKYSKVGIKIDLENLSRLDNGKNVETIKKFVNKDTGISCNQTETKVKIYPKKPYGKTDYTIETELSCDEKEEPKKEDVEETSPTSSKKEETVKKEEKK